MSRRLWFERRDPAVLAVVWRSLGLSPPYPRWNGDLSSLRPLLRSRSVVVDIAPASPLTVRRPSPATGPELLVAGDRVLVILRRQRRWRLETPAGAATVTPEEAMADLDPAVAERWRRAAVWPWRRLGVPARDVDRLSQVLGLTRSLALGEWLQRRRDAVASPRAVVRFAAAAPEVLPCRLPSPAGEKMPWLSLRLHRQLPLARGRSPWRSLLALPRREVRLLLFLLLMAAVGFPLGYGLSLLIAVGVDLVTRAVSLSAASLGLAGTCMLITVLLSAARTWAGARLLARWRLALTDSYLFRIVGSRPGALRRLVDGDLYTRLQDLFTLQGVLLQQVLPAVSSLLVLGGGLLYLLRGAAFVLPILLAGAVLEGLLLGWAVPRLREVRRATLEVASEVRDRVLERITGRHVLRHYDPQGRLLQVLDNLLVQAAELDRRGLVLGASLGLGTGLLGAAAMTAVTVLTAARYRGGEASLGTLVVVLGIVFSLHRALRSLIGAVPAVVTAAPSVHRLEEVIAASEPVAVSSSPPPPAVGPLHLEVRGLVCGWDHTAVLRDVTLTVPPGGWLAVIGASGSGKSTLAAVLGGLLEPWCGRVILDGRDGRYHPERLVRRIAVVSQEIFLFDRSIRHNILVGARGAGEEDLAAAIATAGLRPLLDRLPRGLDHHVGENGTHLSVGERCRIGIARALVRRPGLLVLDEALARVDTATADDIAARLRRHGLSVMLLSHDLRRAATCDWVAVLRDGRVVQQGSFTSLMRRDGELAALLAAKPLAVVPGGAS